MRVVFTVHHHQPIGNRDDVVVAAVEQAYVPLLDTLEAAGPDVSAVVHMSGPLWEWLTVHEPDVAARYGGSERIELLGGGWYEPVLAAIPENDRVDQLEMMHERLETLTGRRPRGAWLGERFWEPSLAGTLARHAIDYVVLDGENLPDDRSPFRPATLDYHGRQVAAFFTFPELRYAMPTRPVADVIDLLEQAASTDPDGVAVFADDGEKFGLWPNGFDHRWLAELFAAVDAHPELQWATLADAFESVPSDGWLALPTCSYAEMNEWSRGSWPALVARQPAGALLYRRMIRQSRLARRAGDDARRHLLRAQCNDGYWHGAFGGVLLPFLRRALLIELIESRIALDGRRSSSTGDVDLLDWSADGQVDAAVEMASQSWIAAGNGRGLYYFDDKPGRWPMTDVATEGETPLVFEDRWESGPDRQYELESTVATKAGTIATFASEGARKVVTGTGRSIVVQYDLDGAPAGRFGPQLPLAVHAEATVRVDGGDAAALDEAGAHDGHRFRIAGPDTPQVLLTFPVPGRVEVTPLTTTHIDENGEPTVTYQGVLLWLSYPTQGTGSYSFHIEVMD